MKSSALLFASSVLFTASAAAAAPDVVVSIKPIHSLVAAIMEGVGEPGLIVEGAASPHTFTMKPSNARAVDDAAIVFWTGPGMGLGRGSCRERLCEHVSITVDAGV